MNEPVLIENWIVSGRVQRVGFRYYAARCAKRHHIDGGARNLSDGRVEIVAVGTRISLDAFFLHIRRGPPAAIVESVHRRTCVGDLPDFDDFDVLFHGG